MKRFSYPADSLSQINELKKWVPKMAENGMIYYNFWIQHRGFVAHKPILKAYFEFAKIKKDSHTIAALAEDKVNCLSESCQSPSKLSKKKF